ncbi:unnamed protein product [Caenorhabditis sp. 36 PRJEB53466]|nr:unnamed protein product [Caenorhabditis sp. 36 PRJEB53466]
MAVLIVGQFTRRTIEPFLLAAFSSQDFRRFQGYQKKMESKAEFDNKRINLIVSASSGAVFRRLTSSAYSYPHKDWNTLRTK